MTKGSGTRSGLLWEVERLIKECTELPQVLVMENVPQVICSDFYEWCEFLESKGYKNYYQLMNARDFGVPQNRNRCFMVSLLGDYYYEFPEPFELKKRLKDVLEDKVDKKYYLSEKGIKCVEKRLEKHIATECQQIGELQGGIYECGFEHLKRVYSIDGCSPTVDTMQGGGSGVKILDEQNGYIRTDGTVGTITTDGSSPKHNNRVIENNIRIRKLTPKECWRLMDFDDEDFEKARKVNSDSQLYKQAGNSIVVNCLYLIFKQLL